MRLDEKSYVELLELYFKLLEQIVELYKAKSPQTEIDKIKDRQCEVREELGKRRQDK